MLVKQAQRTAADSIAPLDVAEEDGEEPHPQGEQRITRPTPPGRVWYTVMVGPDLGRSLQRKFCVHLVCSGPGGKFYHWV